MSDIIWAALLAVGGSSITGGIAYFATIKGAQEQTRRERQRLRDEHVESDRRVRRDNYANYLACLERLDAMVSLYAQPIEREHWEAWLYDFRAAQVAVRLVESPEVLEARRAMDDLLNALAPIVEQAAKDGHSMQDAVGVPYVRMRPGLADAGRALGDAMRADLAYSRPSS